MTEGSSPGETDDRNARALDAHARALAKALKVGDKVPPAVAHRAAFDPVFLQRLLAEQSTAIATSEVATEALAQGLPPWAPPPTASLLVSATQALARWALTGFRPVPAAQLRRRLEGCLACPSLQTESVRDVAALLAPAASARCGLCRCAVGRKARLPTETCPMPRAEDPRVNRWGEPVSPPRL